MPRLTKASTDVRIQYSDPNKYRDIDKGMLQASVDKAREAIEAGQDPHFAILGPLMTIFEGNALPMGITKSQDISTKRASPKLLQQIPQELQSNAPRQTMDKIPRDLAQQLMIEDKRQRLLASGKSANPEDVASAYNAEPAVAYAKHISDTLKAITGEFGNREVQQMLQPLLEKTQKSPTPSSSEKIPFLELFK